MFLFRYLFKTIDGCSLFLSLLSWRCLLGWRRTALHWRRFLSLGLRRRRLFSRPSSLFFWSRSCQSKSPLSSSRFLPNCMLELLGLQHRAKSLIEGGITPAAFLDRPFVLNKLLNSFLRSTFSFLQIGYGLFYHLFVARMRRSRFLCWCFGCSHWALGFLNGRHIGRRCILID